MDKVTEQTLEQALAPIIELIDEFKKKQLPTMSNDVFAEFGHLVMLTIEPTVAACVKQILNNIDHPAASFDSSILANMSGTIQVLEVLLSLHEVYPTKTELNTELNRRVAYEREHSEVQQLAFTPPKSASQVAQDMLDF